MSPEHPVRQATYQPEHQNNSGNSQAHAHWPHLNDEHQLDCRKEHLNHCYRNVGSINMMIAELTRTPALCRSIRGKED